MNEVLRDAIVFLILWGIMCGSGAISVYRDIQRWKRDRASRKLGTVISTRL